MKPQRIPKERLQAMLDHAHQVCRAEDLSHRLDIRAEIAQLERNREISILECWGGDQWPS